MESNQSLVGTPDTSKPLSLQEAKDKVAEKRGWTNWDYACFVWAGFVKQLEPAMDEAAELYCQSQLSSKEERIKELEEEVKHLQQVERALKDAMINGKDLFDSIYFEGEPEPKSRVLERENARLQEQLKAAEALIRNAEYHTTIKYQEQLRSFHESLKQPPTA